MTIHICHYQEWPAFMFGGGGKEGRETRETGQTAQRQDYPVDSIVY